MAEQIKYHLMMGTYDKYFPLVILSFLTIIGGIVLVNFATTGFSLVFMVCWLAVLGYNWVHVAKFPVEMWVTSDRIVILKDRLSRTMRIPMNDFYAIHIRHTMLTIKTHQGTFRGMGSFTGFSQFVEDVRAHNSHITIKGC